MGCVQPHPNKLFFAGVRNEFRFVEDRRADYPVTIMCDVLGVSTAGYYAWRSRPESRRSVANRDLVNDIKRVHRDTSGRYGSFTLLRLPPYAPELNPIENVWEYLRGNYLGHIVWNTYEQIVEACCTAWNAFIHDTERVTSDEEDPRFGGSLTGAPPVPTTAIFSRINVAGHAIEFSR
jgi:hypothetical protein